MATYLLLRNNKESGPYTVEGLVQLGLKPYDLVWEQGRSAAWRYPSEIDALKSFAPAVEEQPFDRFYKKPSQLQKEKEEKEAEKLLQERNGPVKPSVQETIVEIKQQPVQEIKRQEEIIEVAVPKKQVYVSMPANSNAGKTVFIKKAEPVTAKAASGNSSLNDNYKNEEVTDKKAEPVINSRIPSYNELVDDYNNQQYNGKKIPVEKKEFPVEVEEAPVVKYVQSLDEIKDKYAQSLADRKKKTANRQVAANLVRKVLPFAAVLIAGVLMGVFFMNKKTDKADLSQIQQPAENAVPITENKSTVTKTDTTIPSSTGQVQEPAAGTTEAAQSPLTENKTAENNTADVSKLNTSQAEQKNALVPGTTERKNSKTDRKTLPTEVANTPVLTQPKNAETDPVTGERNKVVRSASEISNNNEAAARQTANSLMKQVSVASNEYKRGSFGGIHDLQLTVTNNSNYLLDNVIVELQLLKPNDEPLKTDNIRFSPVPPNGSLTLAIPPSNRGVRVSCKVIHVDSKSAVNDTAGLK